MRKMEESKMVKMKKIGEGFDGMWVGAGFARFRCIIGELGKNEGGRWLDKIRGRRGRWKVFEDGRRNQRRRRLLDKAVSKWTRGKSTLTGLYKWAYYNICLEVWACFVYLSYVHIGLTGRVSYKGACSISIKQGKWDKIGFSPFILIWTYGKPLVKNMGLLFGIFLNKILSLKSIIRLTSFESDKKVKKISCSPIFLYFFLNRLSLMRSVKSKSNDSANTWQKIKLVYTRVIRKRKMLEVVRKYISRAEVLYKHHPSFFLTTQSYNLTEKMSYKHHHSLPYARLQRETIGRVNMVSIEPKLLSANAINSSMSLLIRVVSSRIIPVAAVNRAIKNFWRFSNPFLVEDYNNNVFKISVACEEDLRYLCFHSPGIVLSHHAFIRLWSAHTPFNHVDIMHSSIWVQVRDLALSQNTIDNLLKLSARIGHLDMIDYDMDGLDDVKVLRFKVYVSVDDPLITGVFTTQEDGLCWIKFYYENVGLVCFNCGIMGHHKEDCMKPVKRMARDSSEYLLSDWSAKMLIRSPDRPIYGLYWKNGLKFEPANYNPIKNGIVNQDEQVVPNLEVDRPSGRRGDRYFNSGSVDSEETIRVRAVENRGYIGECSKKAEGSHMKENGKELEFIPIEVEDSSESSAAANMYGTGEKECDHFSMLIFKRMEDVSSESGGKKRPRMWSAETLDDDQFDGVELEMGAGKEEEKASESGSNRIEAEGGSEGVGNNLMGTSPAHKQGIRCI